MKCAGLIFNHSPHYIDHLAPLCSLLNWPLFVCEPEIAESCRTFYPNLTVVETDLFSLSHSLPNTIVCCENRILLEHALPFLKQPYRMIWLPHGLSDKGWGVSAFEALGKEDLLLIYGPKMAHVLAAKKIDRPAIQIGSYRLQYFRKHQAYYETQVNARFGSSRFHLYAPTWNDWENNGLFWEVYPFLASAIPNRQKLLIKLHPNTELKYLPEIEMLKGHAPTHVSFVEHFPPIYPLLSRADSYIGDLSSIGYDFLHFQKPLFFTVREKKDPRLDPSAYLMRAGVQLLPSELNQLLNPNLSYAEEGKKVLEYGFQADENWIQQVQSWV